MSWHIRPAVREDTPLIIGIAGPTKSGKTYSSHRLAQALRGDRDVVMLNAEGKRGHQYADKFKYLALDIEPPFSAARYTEAVLVMKQHNPGCVIIDSCSHMHDGPGGLLDQHEKELDRMAGQDFKKRERATWAAWVKPKADENAFIYTLLGLECPVILCFRAKEKIKIVKGQEPIDLGWQPIVSDRVAFETMFTLMLPPHSKGAPDLSMSDMREPFDTIIKSGEQIDEALGATLLAWAKGAHSAPAGPGEGVTQAGNQTERITDEQRKQLEEAMVLCDKFASEQFLKIAKIGALEDLPASDFVEAVQWVTRRKARLSTGGPS